MTPWVILCPAKLVKSWADLGHRYASLFGMEAVRGEFWVADGTIWLRRS